jgi:hypothetical protein
LSPAEQAAFLALAFTHDAIRLRRIDGRAKDSAAVTPSFEDVLASNLGPRGARGQAISSDRSWTFTSSAIAPIRPSQKQVLRPIAGLVRDAIQ